MGKRIEIPDGFISRMCQRWNAKHKGEQVTIHSITTEQMYEVLDEVL